MSVLTAQDVRRDDSSFASERMTIPAENRISTLRFASDGDPEEKALPLGASTGLAGEREIAAPTAYVVRMSDIAKLIACTDLTDCGTQKRTGRNETTIQLSRHVLGKRPRVPLVRAVYGNAGRLRAGVRSLLDQAKLTADGNVYVVGAPDMTFETLRAEVRHQRQAGSGLRCGFLENVVVPHDLEKTFMGKSAPFVDVRKRIIAAAANDDLTTLICGETGTGKEIVARAIHAYSMRNGLKFVTVNCAGIPDDLLEMELFGCEGGAVTGVPKLKIGMWEYAGKGTLFLDEIGDMPLQHQRKVLRAIEDRTIRRVGGNADIPVYARVIAATNRDLEAMMEKGEFRRDLYARLAGLMIATPSLRESPEDFDIIAQELWLSITLGAVAPLTGDILSILPDHTRIGNIRELKNSLRRLYAYMKVENLTAADAKYAEDAIRTPWQGRPPAPQKVSSVEMERYRSRCLLTLGEASRKLRRCEITIRPFIRGENDDAGSLDALAFSLGRTQDDLEQLCIDPSAFNTHEAFVAVSDLTERLAQIQCLLRSEPARASGYWQSEMREPCRHALSRIADAITRLG